MANTVKKTIFWFRQDLRLFDNPGLYEALQKGPVMAIYILDDESSDFKMGSAGRWWLHRSLAKLNQKLDHKLNIYQGNAQDIILRLVKDHKIEAVYWNRCYDPWRVQHDSVIKSALKESDIECKSFNASLLWEPWERVKADGTPYKVFSPFYHKGCLQGQPPRQPLPIPPNLNLIQDPLQPGALEESTSLPVATRFAASQSYWPIGEEGAQERLKHFLENGLHTYKEGRNIPGQDHVSRLSPHLHFGEISPHQVWWTIQKQRLNSDIASYDIDHFLSELGWREFSYYLLYHFPNLPHQNFQKKFDHFPWQTNHVLLEAWQQGQTGYPIVDAGMRELWQTGYMHNRVRMIVGSFLVKNLLLHWRHGEEWFWECLVDADLANNSASWQWVAGSGVDASPYFRIFNPVTQGEKFDPEGTYTKRFVPELKNMPPSYLFKPWEAPAATLQAAGVTLGQTYPKPIVDLKESRQRALNALASLSTTQVL